MVFLQACSTSTSRKTESSPNNDTKTIKTDNGNSDESQVNLANTCPRGLVCAFPGRCTLYTDRDYDKICDRSITQERYYDREL